MSISDNMLATFLSGETTPQDDIEVFNEMLRDENLHDVVDCAMVLDSFSDLNELRENFDSTIDKFDNFNDFKEINFQWFGNF